MQQFIARHAGQVMGVVSGFDRLLFRGFVRGLSFVEGMSVFLSRAGILLKDFGTFVSNETERLKSSVEALAERHGRPVEYLHSSALRKEDVARRILQRHPIAEGLIAILSCVEPCLTYEIHRSRQKKRLELRHHRGKCLHYYLYLLHPQFGFSHLRVQTWFPFTVQVCLNGREWLARDLEAKGIGFQRRDNCLTWIADIARAQRLLDRQVMLNWPRTLDGLVRDHLPALSDILRRPRPKYYWCAHQTEWATDVMFGDASVLQRIYRPLVLHAITHFQSRDVMRFLGRKTHHAFAGEVVSDFKDRPEGIRVKHSVGHNSVKVYDKQGSVLRVETTVNDPRDLRTLRPKRGTRKIVPQPLRKSVADLHRRVAICQEVNERYLDALANVDVATPVKDLVDHVCRGTSFRGRRARALQPWSRADAQLLAAVNRGDFVLSGFRNRDIVAILFPTTPASTTVARQRRSKVTRLLRLLRAHGIARRIPRSHRYQITSGGRTLITAILAARDASVSSLLKTG